jgi:uncharacterized protein
MSGKIGQLKDLLGKITQNPDVRGSLIISKTGLVISTNLKDKIQQETFAAMVATMLGASTAALQEFGKGEPDYMLSCVTDGTLIAMDAGPKAILVTMMGTVQGVDKVLELMRNVRVDIKDLVR